MGIKITALVQLVFTASCIDVHSMQVVQDLTGQGWKLSCTTQNQAEIDPTTWDSPKMSTYKILFDDMKAEGINKCDEYSPQKAIDVSVPGEVHQQLNQAGILKEDILWRLEE